MRVNEYLKMVAYNSNNKQFNIEFIIYLLTKLCIITMFENNFLYKKHTNNFSSSSIRLHA